MVAKLVLAQNLNLKTSPRMERQFEILCSGGGDFPTGYLYASPILFRGGRPFL
jgi:hypothetical protein